MTASWALTREFSRWLPLVRGKPEIFSDQHFGITSGKCPWFGSSGSEEEHNTTNPAVSVEFKTGGSVRIIENEGITLNSEPESTKWLLSKLMETRALSQFGTNDK
jgi:hypothetical protein